MAKIVVLDGYALNPGDLSWKGLEEIAEVKVYDRTDASDVLSRADGFDIILTNKVVITAEHIKALPSLRYIGVTATGYNVVDTEAAKQAGVVVTNIPAYSTESVAQKVFALILAVTNHVEHYADLNRYGRWSQNADFCYWNTPLTELHGKKMGIIGLGNTGMATARIAQAFGMDVYACTSKTPLQLLHTGIHKAEFEGLLSTCDFVSLNCPLTDSTRQMMNRSTIEKMKNTAMLINTGRGQLVNDVELAQCLNERVIYAYGADVLSVEPPSKDHPLIRCQYAYITPHIAWATTEARQRLMSQCVENVKAYIDGKPINVVNK